MLIKFMRGAWPVHPFFTEDTVRHHSAVNLGGKKIMSIGYFFFSESPDAKYMKWLLQFFHSLSGSKQKTRDGEIKFIVKPSIC